METIFIGVLLFVAACAQGAIGFGLGMLAAPIIALMRPDLLPGLILLLAFGFSLATWARDRGAVEWPVVGWSLLGRVPGSVLGTWAVVAMPVAGLKIILAAAVILGTLVSLVGWSPGHGRKNSFIAGASGGFLGTTTAIGGPPLALIMRSMSPERVRGTLSVCFVIGSAISIALLTGAGALESMHLRAALLYAPAVIAGFFLSSVVNRHLNRRLIFLGSVTISLIGSVMVITQAAGIF
ncbi:TSUP family transporter [Corynebacterium gallinarum]|uniref:Probable membrane transporter protein n=1 Tax=Corynebacterium gallinarum TaxID=2762214 RepID=A0A8I0LHD7_9CORY|nr:sulfite exporter TauE/SafE family protein [Corynebacterium gallinarum]MBD8030620.1 sulfite exporter TauE/SafE family protein [Corynebacterium gallinarum]